MNNDLLKINKEKIILDQIFQSKAFNEIKLIGIAGSVGRGEKTLLDTNLNDIDLFIVAGGVDLIRKTRLEEELNRLLNTKFTDITFYTERKFNNEVNSDVISQFWFDTLKGSYILYKDDSFNYEKERYLNKKYRVKINSSYTVFFTRLWCLMGPYRIIEYKFLVRDFDLAFYQLKKAISAVIDAVLIKEMIYDTPIKQEKLIKFTKTNFYLANTELVDDVLMYYTQNNLIVEDIYEVYRKVLDLYLLCRDYIFGKNSLIKVLFMIDYKFPLKLILMKHKSKKIRQYIERYNLLLQLKEMLEGNLSKSEITDIADKLDKIYNEAF